MTNRLSAILGPDGKPFMNGSANGSHRNGTARTQLTPAQFKMFFDQANTFLEALGMIGAPAMVRAQDPFSNNPWIFASAMVQALSGGQAPLKIYRETARGMSLRQRKAQEMGRLWEGAKSGKRRRSVERHLSKSWGSRFSWHSKGIEEDVEHPLHDLLRRPNEHQNGKQFVQFLIFWLSTRFEAFAIKGDADGLRLKLATDQPETLWPYGPDFFAPIYEKNTYGKQVGWWFKPPNWSPISQGPGAAPQRLELHEVIQFKLPNPNNPLRGMARMTPVALQIELDELMANQDRNLLKRGATPKGIMTYDGQIDEGEVSDKKKSYEEEYGSTDNAGSTLFLHGGWKYQAVGWSPQQMQNKESREWNRETELAVMGTSLSALGISSADTYAAELIHDKGLWTKSIIPIQRIIEEAFDNTLFYPETDDVFPGFDNTDVEALRAGLEHQVSIADKMCGPNLHANPRVAYEVVGMEVPQYEGDDKAFVSGMMSTAADIVNPAPAPEVVPTGGTPKEPKVPTDPDQETPTTPADGNPPDDAAEAAKLRAPSGIIRVSKDERITRARRKWADFVKVEFAIEKMMKEAFRGWVGEQRREILRRFDEATKGKAANINLTQVLPDPEDAKRGLIKRTRPVHGAALDATWKMTEEEIGVPTFDMGDDRIMSFFDRREKLFLDSTTGTLINRVRGAIEKGVQADETIQEIRMRVSGALDIEAGSSRGLLVARTETAGFMNGVRDEMFGAEGFEEFDWSTAGDQNVRDSHVAFGAAGTKPRGFNWMTIVGEPGVLLYPGDMQGPVGEVVNCRCLHVPGETTPGKSADTVRMVVRAVGKKFDERLAAYEASREKQDVHLHLTQTVVPAEMKAPQLTVVVPPPPAATPMKKVIERDGKGRLIGVTEVPALVGAAGGEGA